MATNTLRRSTFVRRNRTTPLLLPCSSANPRQSTRSTVKLQLATTGVMAPHQCGGCQSSAATAKFDVFLEEFNREGLMKLSA